MDGARARTRGVKPPRQPTAMHALVCEVVAAPRPLTVPATTQPARPHQFKYPATWKAGKILGNEHLYDLEVKPANKGGSGSIKVTVDKTSANSLAEFGTLEEVAEKRRSQLQALLKGQPVSVARLCLCACTCPSAR